MSLFEKWGFASKDGSLKKSEQEVQVPQTEPGVKVHSKEVYARALADAALMEMGERVRNIGAQAQFQPSPVPDTENPDDIMRRRIASVRESIAATPVKSPIADQPEVILQEAITPEVQAPPAIDAWASLEAQFEKDKAENIEDFKQGNQPIPEDFAHKSGLELRADAEKWKNIRPAIEQAPVVLANLLMQRATHKTLREARARIIDACGKDETIMKAIGSHLIDTEKAYSEKLNLLSRPTIEDNEPLTKDKEETIADVLRDRPSVIFELALI